MAQLTTIYHIAEGIGIVRHTLEKYRKIAKLKAFASLFLKLFNHYTFDWNQKCIDGFMNRNCYEIVVRLPHEYFNRMKNNPDYQRYLDNNVGVDGDWETTGWHIYGMTRSESGYTKKLIPKRKSRQLTFEKTEKLHYLSRDFQCIAATTIKKWYRSIRSKTE